MTLSYDPDKYPPCPNCETDLFVGRYRYKKFSCHFCGWVSDDE